MKKIILHLSILIISITSAYAHEDNEERIKFWKEYYNPKVEVSEQNIPSVKITLIKNKPFYQVRTQIKNFTFTPEKNMENNIPSEGYGKLYINGDYVSRIYSEYHFVKILPVGNNEIKVILSTNLDHDIASNGNVISKPHLTKSRATEEQEAGEIYLKVKQTCFASVPYEKHPADFGVSGVPVQSNFTYKSDLEEQGDKMLHNDITWRAKNNRYINAPVLDWQQAGFPDVAQTSVKALYLSLIHI